MHYIPHSEDNISTKIEQSTIKPDQSSCLTWTVEEVCSWLKEEKLSELEHLFREQEIDGVVLLETPDSDWEKVIPIMGKRF